MISMRLMQMGLFAGLKNFCHNGTSCGSSHFNFSH